MRELHTEPGHEPEIDIAELDAAHGTVRDRVALVVSAVGCFAILASIIGALCWMFVI